MGAAGFLAAFAVTALTKRSVRATIRQRPYRDEYTGSLSNSEVNRRRARLVLPWGTGWEDLWVLLALLLPLFGPARGAHLGPIWDPSTGAYMGAKRGSDLGPFWGDFRSPNPDQAGPQNGAFSAQIYPTFLGVAGPAGGQFASCEFHRALRPSS